MPQANKGDKVQVHYTGKLDDGSIFYSSGGSGDVLFSPEEFVIGQKDDELLPAFQEAVIGLEPGQRVQVRIACADAYGPRLEERVFTAPRGELSVEEEVLEDWCFYYHSKRKVGPTHPKKGDRVEFSWPDGSHAPAYVIEVTDTTYTFDANHPLAGQNLTYDITLVNIL